jgi:hypothetical protein
MPRFSLSTLKSKVAAASALIAISATSMAADEVDPSSFVTTLYADLTKQVTNLIGQTWPLLVTILGSTIVMTLSKKYARKAT